MKRREEIDLLQRTLERLMNLIEDENNDTPTKEELLNRVNTLSEHINTMAREIKQQGEQSMFTLWLALRHVPGHHAIISRADQIASGGMNNEAIKVLRYDDMETGDAHFIALNFNSDSGEGIDFSGVPREAVATVSRPYQDAALTLYDEWINSQQVTTDGISDAVAAMTERAIERANKTAKDVIIPSLQAERRKREDANRNVPTADVTGD